MKRGIFLSAMMLLGAVQSQAIVRPGWERPIQTAQLTTNSNTIERVMSLTMNRQDGVRQPTSFTALVDTGIRCVTTPCPSTRYVQFRITNIQRFGAQVVYTAIENLVVPPGVVGPIAKFMTVTASHGVWSVEVNHFGRTTLYQGYPQPVATIQAFDEHTDDAIGMHEGELSDEETAE